MKLVNKKTGKIIDSDELLTDKFILDLFSRDFAYFCSKLAKIQEEWEDYEETKEYWYIECDGEVYSIERLIGYDSNKLKEIGNYFDTREEAEKAVEKLKAVKRLKDKGFRFTGWGCENQKLYVKIGFNKKAWATETEPDLDLLFGGEE